MMTANIFDDLPNVFEELVDWPKRLANESPFYRRLFQRVGVGSVVDVACGTGRHAAMFHSWNLRVEGSDLSPQMIACARKSSGEPPGLRWVVRSFDAPIEPAAPFDAAICVGNSLALAPDLAVVECAIRQMLSALRSGGVVVVHVLNLWHLPEGPCVWHKSKRLTLPQGEAFIARGVHRCGCHGYVEWIVADLSGAVPMRGETARLLALEAPGLEHMARQAGAAEVSFFGGYQEQPYDRGQSVDLLMVAEK